MKAEHLLRGRELQLLIDKRKNKMNDEQVKPVERRFEKERRRDEFVKKHLDEILGLNMDGYPKTREMDVRWVRLAYKAREEGFYSTKTAICDIIGQLNKIAKQL